MGGNTWAERKTTSQASRTVYPPITIIRTIPCNWSPIIAQFVKAVRVKRDYEIEVEFNVAFDEFQQIYLEPEKAEDKARGTTTILALAEKVGQAV